MEVRLQGTGGGAWCKWLQPPPGGAILLLEVFNANGQDDYGNALLSGPGAQSWNPPTVQRALTEE